MDESQPSSPEPVAAAAAVAPELEPAGFWVRGGAVLLDTILMGAVGGLAGVGLLRLGVPPFTRVAFSFLLGAAYKIVTIGAWGQTVGKMAAGVEVLTEDGGKVGYGRATGRYFATYLSTLTAYLGFVMAAFTDRKRALHDYLAGTRVVYRPAVGRGRRAVMAALGVAFPVASVALGWYLAFKVFLPVRLMREAARRMDDGEFQLAERDYTRLIELAPKNPAWRNERCWERALEGKNLDGALEDCEQSLRLRVTPEALDSRGMVYLKMKRYQDAVDSYSAALKAAPSLPPSLYGRALARLALGDKEGSIADGRAATKLDPDISVRFRRYGTDLLDDRELAPP